jgi:hypothetical protein
MPPRGLEPMSHTSVALAAQYLNVRQRKLGTIINQTVHILHHYIVRTRVHCPWRTFSSTIKLLPNTPARQLYRYTSVPMEAAMLDKNFLHKYDNLLASSRSVYCMNKVHIAEKVYFRH